jgi:opacity protein-like surface antigen
MKTSTFLALIASAMLLVVPFNSANAVQDGWFVGASVGSAQVEASIAPGDLPGNIPSPPTFDENDFGWKLYGGYNWVLAKTFGFGIEGGFVNFGSPSADILSLVTVKVEPTAMDLFATLGFDIGPVGIFGKVGYAWWDVDVSIADLSASDDGNDPVYGIGARFNLWSLEIRGEYEIFDVSDVDDLTLWSLGVVWRF